MFTEQSIPLDPHSDVFTAELMALVDALTELETWLGGSEASGATIWTDSQSSIDAIFSPVISQPLALEAHNLILKLKRQGHPISLRWIPGHKDHTGNELADRHGKRSCARALALGNTEG